MNAHDRRGRAVLGAVTTTVVCVMPVFLVGGLAVQIGAELGFSPAGLGLAVSAYFGMSALSSVPAGVLVERYGGTVVARAGIVLAAACLLAIALVAHSYPALVVLLGAGAAANSLGQLAANAALSRVPARRQGLSFGIKQAAIPVATLLAGASVPTVALTVGWRWAFACAAALAAGALPLVPSDGRGRRPAGAASLRAVREARGAKPPAAGVNLRALIVVGAAVALAAGAAGSLGTFLVDASVTRGLAPGTAGLALTLGSVACVIGRVGSGWLADARGAHGDVATVAVMLTIGAGGLALLAATGTAPLVIGVLLGFGLGWAWPGLVNFAVVQLHPHTPAAATSITQTGVYLGGCLGPLGFGAAAAARGYPFAWLCGGVAMLLAASLMLLGRHLLHRPWFPARGASPAR